MAHWLLLYDLADDYLDRRPGFRRAHLAHAEAAVARGELMLGGALADPADREVLLFEADDASVAEAFAAADPYVVAGLVKRWQVRRWTTVVGPLAAQPVAL